MGSPPYAAAMTWGVGLCERPANGVRPIITTWRLSGSTGRTTQWTTGGRGLEALTSNRIAHVSNKCPLPVLAVALRVGNHYRLMASRAYTAWVGPIPR